MKTDVKGCSNTAKGQEKYETFSPSHRANKIIYQYDYRHINGMLFSCVAPSLEKCRNKRNTNLKLSKMTNAEINLEVAVKALEEGKLKSSAANFIESIKDYDKNDLRKLTRKQYSFLNSIYNQFK